MVNSRKHLIQTSLTSVPLGTVEVIELGLAVQNEDSELANQFAVGAVIKAVYVEYWIQADSSQPSTYTTIVLKRPGDATTITAIEMAQLHTYTGKKNILETHQGIVGDANSNPIPMFRHWIKIPKGKQRFGLNDRIQIAILGLTGNVEICGMAIYKSYT